MRRLFLWLEKLSYLVAPNMFPHMKQLFCLVFYFASFGIGAQTVLDNSEFMDASDFKVLPDDNYSIEQVSGEMKNNFIDYRKVADYKDVPHYWFRVIVTNNSDEPRRFYLICFPNLNNWLYVFNRNTKDWKQSKSGFSIADGQRQQGMFPYLATAKTTDTLYIKVDVSALSKSKTILQPRFGFWNAEIYDKQDSLTFIAWFTTCAIILIFFLYNLYIYFIFKDKAYLYYLMIQAGAIFYITSYRRYLNVLLDSRYYTAELSDNGLYTFDLNIVLMQIALALIINGFVQYARIYLETQKLVPILDTILNRLNYVFCCILLVSTVITISGIFYAYRFTVMYTNLLIVAILLLTIIIAIVCWRMKLKQAKYFLAANSFAVLTVIAITVVFLTNRSTQGPDFLPNFAILSQTLAFAIALVARINVIKEELKASELEAQLLRKDNEQIQIKNQLIALENEYVNAQMAVEKSEKEKLHEKLEYNQRELASTTLYLFQKNEMLTTLQKQIEELPKAMLPNENIQQIKSTIKSNLFLDADWEKFKLHFEKVHPDFFIDLKEKHPTLTPYEIRLCAYFHLQLSPKEIAGLLNINPTSVHRAKTRLLKKMKDSENPE